MMDSFFNTLRQSLFTRSAFDLLAWLILGLLSVPIAAVGLLTIVPWLQDVLWQGPMKASTSRDQGHDWLFALLALPPLGLLGVGWWRLRRSYALLACGFGLLAAAYAYLAWDDSKILHGLTYEEVSPSFAGDRERYEILMRYGSHHSPAKEFKEPTHLSDASLPGRGGAPTTPEGWRTWVAKNRAAAFADWEDLLTFRQWLLEINTWPRFPDLTEGPDPEILSFKPFRVAGTRAAALSRIYALENKGDEAIAVLLPLLQVARKLEPSARTLVRAMIARALQRQMMNEVTFVLDVTTISLETRASLIDALNTGVGSRSAARHLLAGEYVYALNPFLETEGDKSLDQLITKLAWPRVLFFNPRRTVNLYWTVNQAGQDFVEQRQSADFEQAMNQVISEYSKPRFKNIAGQKLAKAAQSAFGKIAKHYWEIEDQRVALIERLNEKEAKDQRHP